MADTIVDAVSRALDAHRREVGAVPADVERLGDGVPGGEGGQVSSREGQVVGNWKKLCKWLRDMSSCSC